MICSVRLIRVGVYLHSGLGPQEAESSSGSQATPCLNTPRDRQTWLQRACLGSATRLLLEPFGPLGEQVSSAVKHWENDSV